MPGPWLPLDRFAVLDKHYRHRLTWRFLFPLGRRYGLVLVRQDRERRPLPTVQPGEPWVRPVVQPGDYHVPPRQSREPF